MAAGKISYQSFLSSCFQSVTQKQFVGKPPEAQCSSLQDCVQQCCQDKVTFLEQCISEDSKHLTSGRISAIFKALLPMNQKALRGLLGILGYCCQWVPNMSSIAVPLNEITKASKPNQLCEWRKEAKEVVKLLKENITSPQALALPNYPKPSLLYCHESNGHA